MLKSVAVVLDCDSVCHKEIGFIIKGFSIGSENYSDTMLFLRVTIC